jgi:hypothetical protein
MFFSLYPGLMRGALPARMRAALVRTRLVKSGLALFLAGMLGNGQADDAARAHDVSARAAQRPVRERLSGEHEVRAAIARAGLELALRRGFEVRLGKAAAPREVVLRVAPERARADEIAAGFVPVGPTVELRGASGRADVSFIADQFRVRAGHRLVLAVERTPPCAAGTCWLLLPARSEHGRCLARGVEAPGRRLQFGSLPAP